MKAGWKNRIDERRYFEAKLAERAERASRLRLQQWKRDSLEEMLRPDAQVAPPVADIPPGFQSVEQVEAAWLRRDVASRFDTNTQGGADIERPETRSSLTTEDILNIWGSPGARELWAKDLERQRLDKDPPSFEFPAAIGPYKSRSEKA